MIIDNTNIWNYRFMDMAHLVATWSKDPSSKVGAVIVDANRRIISTGYNGLAIGVEDSIERLTNRDIKYKIILHAEENAIMFAKRDLSGCSLYVTTLPPCAHCASLIIQSGIKTVYACKSDIPERWKESYDLTTAMFNESGVNLVFLDYENKINLSQYH
jgi:dCMP deaminase